MCALILGRLEPQLGGFVVREALCPVLTQLSNTYVVGPPVSFLWLSEVVQHYIFSALLLAVAVGRTPLQHWRAVQTRVVDSQL